MKRLLLATTLLATPAFATNYVIELGTGTYTGQVAGVLLDPQSPPPPQVQPSVPVTQTPLPSAIWLFATGLAGITLLRRKR